jgi:hypothetical protein
MESANQWAHLEGIERACQIIVLMVLSFFVDMKVGAGIGVAKNRADFLRL